VGGGGETYHLLPEMRPPGSGLSRGLPQLSTYSDISYLRITNAINISQRLTLDTPRSQRVNPAFRI